MSKIDVIKKYSLLVDFNCPTFKFENIPSHFYEIKMFSKLTVGHFKFNCLFILIANEIASCREVGNSITNVIES